MTPGSTAGAALRIASWLPSAGSTCTPRRVRQSQVGVGLNLKYCQQKGSHIHMVYDNRVYVGLKKLIIVFGLRDALPTLGPKAYEYYLLRAIWIPREMGEIYEGTRSTSTRTIVICSIPDSHIGACMEDACKLAQADSTCPKSWLLLGGSRSFLSPCAWTPNSSKQAYLYTWTSTQVLLTYLKPEVVQWCFSQAIH